MPTIRFFLGRPSWRQVSCRAGYHGYPCETTQELEGEAGLDRLPRTWSKFEMKLLGDVIDWIRSRAGRIWRTVAPHVGPGVASGAAADIVRRRRELVFENAMLRH